MAPRAPLASKLLDREIYCLSPAVFFSDSNDRSIDWRPSMNLSLNLSLKVVSGLSKMPDDEIHSTICVKVPRAANNVFFL